MTRKQLQQLTDNNVVMLRFIRKTDNKNRVMVCTTSKLLLESQEGLMKLHYRKTNNLPPYNPLPDNVIVWDINEQDYRQIPAPRVAVLNKVSALDYLKILKQNNK